MYSLLKKDCEFDESSLMNEDGIKLMLHPGFNNSVQSVLQCFIAVVEFRSFFMLNKEVDKGALLLKNLKRVFVDNFKPEVSFLKGYTNQINLTPFKAFLLQSTPFDPNIPLDASLLVDGFFARLGTELANDKEFNFDSEAQLLAYYNDTDVNTKFEAFCKSFSSLLDEFRSMLLIESRMCKDEHVSQRMTIQSIIDVNM